MEYDADSQMDETSTSQISVPVPAAKDAPEGDKAGVAHAESSENLGTTNSSVDEVALQNLNMGSLSLTTRFSFGC